MQKTLKKICIQCSLVIIIISLLVGCNFPSARDKTVTNTPEPSLSNLEQELVTFIVKIPQPLSAGDSVFISFLDEVTGLALNPQKHIMQAEDELTYTVTLACNLGSVIKYRYSREGSNRVNEHLFNGRAVRYRLYHVEGPGKIEDVVSRWTDTENSSPTGRIMGKIIDSSSGKPIPNILATAGGEQAYTLADGSFLLEGLPPTTHNLVFYSLDGTYHIFQQGATVAANSTTPVLAELSRAKLVRVIFTVNVPTDTPVDAPIRLAGNISQLGNTFADLSGGVSTLASRMPVLGKLSDGKYTVTLKLPVGTYLEYKYTLGDGLWSSELTSNSEINLRKLIIPSTKLEEIDFVTSWQTAATGPVRFGVRVPTNTPQNEIVSIQFNPGYGWLEPLPMWPIMNPQGEQVWNFVLTGPFNDLTSIRYRYCRQNQCGSADDTETMGVNPTGREINLTKESIIIEDQVSTWAWLSSANDSTGIADFQATPREKGFIAGVELQPKYHPSWGPLYSQAIDDAQRLDVNTLLFSPTWTFTNESPPILEQLASQDILWPDLTNIVNQAQERGLSTGIYPIPNFPIHEDLWWQNSKRDFPWWVSFFERYSNFVLHHASLASSTKSPVLVIGGDWIYPALPDGLLSDGSPSNVPQDAETRWRELIKEVRDRYSGKIAWAIPYSVGMTNPPPFIDDVDQVYVLWSAPLGNEPNTSVEDMKVQANAILTQEIFPFQQQIRKPVIIAISYPSVEGGAAGCITVSGGVCIDYDQLSPPNPDIPEVALNLQEQANAYHAILSAINENSWIAGYFSMGYYPPAILQDKSISIHGKPAEKIMWYWSQNFLNR